MEIDEDEIYHELYARILWSVETQQSLIVPAMAQKIYNYLCDVALKHDSHVIGGKVFQDHVQLIIKFSPHYSFEDLLKNLKVASMLWIRTNFPSMKSFEWQKSDFAFSLGSQDVGSVIEKINNTKSFLDEVHSLLEEHEIQYDRQEILE